MVTAELGGTDLDVSGLDEGIGGDPLWLVGRGDHLRDCALLDAAAALGVVLEYEDGFLLT